MPKPKTPASPKSPELIIITGLSGSGKGTALKALEDLGFYAVDNLPVSLIPKFAELVQQAQGVRQAALVVDIREGNGLRELPRVLKQLKQTCQAELLFLEASDEVLLRRFSETRRPHPLKGEGNLLESIRREREQLASIRRIASHVIDTSSFSVHELRTLIRNRYASGTARTGKPLVLISSFGYRFGIPAESDLVFDVRFLPNPHYVPELRQLTGKHPKVVKYMNSFPDTGAFLDQLQKLLAFLLPRYLREDKSYVTIAFGCTAGRHRSVMIAEHVARWLRQQGFEVKCRHRDIRREQ